ncbi:unnamed protein product [Amoebophrya sp. A25]|nr:unnamed protein product [Amoebophrya sp. A25]|eukprot:GSA25T00019921001.1
MEVDDGSEAVNLRRLFGRDGKPMTSEDIQRPSRKGSSKLCSITDGSGQQPSIRARVSGKAREVDSSQMSITDDDAAGLAGGSESISAKHAMKTRMKQMKKKSAAPSAATSSGKNSKRGSSRQASSSSLRLEEAGSLFADEEEVRQVQKVDEGETSEHDFRGIKMLIREAMASLSFLVHPAAEVPFLNFILLGRLPHDLEGFIWEKVSTWSLQNTSDEWKKRRIQYRRTWSRIQRDTWWWGQNEGDDDLQKKNNATRRAYVEAVLAAQTQAIKKFDTKTWQREQRKSVRVFDLESEAMRGDAALSGALEFTAETLQLEKMEGVELD